MEYVARRLPKTGMTAEQAAEKQRGCHKIEQLNRIFYT